MSRGQAGFFIGFVIVVFLWVAGFWVALGAVFAGVIGWAVARIAQGDVDLTQLAERISGNDNRSS